MEDIPYTVNLVTVGKINLVSKDMNTIKTYKGGCPFFERPLVIGKASSQYISSILKRNTYIQALNYRTPCTCQNTGTCLKPSGDYSFVSVQC